ncbi:hypothetical protein K437DRAFT_186658 [Tilletiaria anomala UBC 951]|uniref:Uncharacterized protein n=1 Tax=Tilletiaria anomala (strain ATCC 24038 / CBS 436.72 / UBC 951) TaxID=1037660 RepID=A0A066WF04_TILAU|nr:uncharacterized protein K437DRAFT_186658 [Tilletiaria anomala UBC 951]KDN52542.1 hypothetical protein K437DRAFT_186658 [Tilletiaria anomala UBC 951]
MEAALREPTKHTHHAALHLAVSVVAGCVKDFRFACLAVRARISGPQVTVQDGGLDLRGKKGRQEQRVNLAAKLGPQSDKKQVSDALDPVGNAAVSPEYRPRCFPHVVLFSFTIPNTMIAFQTPNACKPHDEPVDFSISTECRPIKAKLSRFTGSVLVYGH